MGFVMMMDQTLNVELFSIYILSTVPLCVYWSVFSEERRQHQALYNFIYAVIIQRKLVAVRASSVGGDVKNVFFKKSKMEIFL